MNNLFFSGPRERKPEEARESVASRRTRSQARPNRPSQRVAREPKPVASILVPSDRELAEATSPLLAEGDRPEGAHFVEFPVYYYLIEKHCVVAIVREYPGRLLIGYDLNAEAFRLLEPNIVGDKLLAKQVDITSDPVFAQAMAAVYGVPGSAATAPRVEAIPAPRQ